MKTKNFRNGSLTARCYMKPAGNGYEVGFVYGGKTVFVGNFILTAEANKWWATMNREITAFNKRNKVTTKFPKNNYGKFLGAYLYNCYYKFLNTAFSKHTRHYGKVVNKNTRALRTWNRRAVGTRVPFLKAA